MLTRVRAVDVLATPLHTTKGDTYVADDDASGEPVRLEDADYAWRVEVTRDEWQAAMRVLVGEITYPNFKSAVHDPAHHDAYMKVWGAMLALDDR